MTTRRFDHIHLACANLAASELFYTNDLGGRLVARYSWRGINSVALDFGGTRLNLRDRNPQDGGPLDHFGLAVTGLDSLYRALGQSQAQLIREPKPWEPEVIGFSDSTLNLAGDFAFVRGPDGELIELVERPR